MSVFTPRSLVVSALVGLGAAAPLALPSPAAAQLLPRLGAKLGAPIPRADTGEATVLPVPAKPQADGGQPIDVDDQAKGGAAPGKAGKPAAQPIAPPAAAPAA